MQDETGDWHEPVRAALETARVEVVQRMRSKGCPLAVTASRLAVIANEDRTGWSSEWRQQEVSGFRDLNAQTAIGDSSVSNRVLGLRPQLEPLAQLLAEKTDLASRPHPFVGTQGVERILSGYLVPLASTYLRDLRTLESPDEQLLARLGDEVAGLATSSTVTRVHQLAVSGIYVDGHLEYRDVLIRPLTEVERGTFVEVHMPSLTQLAHTDEYSVPRLAIGEAPETLIEIRTTRPVTEMQDSPTLPQRIALAMFLEGHHIASLGYVQSFDLPRWASIGVSSTPIAVNNVRTGASTLLDQEAFKRVVDLAHQTPEFGASESSREEVILHRLLRACGADSRNEAFLDFAICLEAALLRVERDELAYRFRLYGSLFLSDRRQPQETFEKLRGIYRIRSKLVHGSVVPPDQLRVAQTDAHELAIAVVRKSIEEGWPDKEALDRMALTLE